MKDKAKELIPPGLLYIADNVTSKQNILGAPKEAGAAWAADLKLPKEAETVFFAGCGYQYSSDLESMLSLIRKMDKSVVGSEVPMALANFQKKLGLDLAGVYRKLRVKDSKSGGQVLIDAVRVLRSLNIEFGYLAENEPCCGGILHYIGLQSDFAQNAQEIYQYFKSRGVKRIISIVPSCTYTLRDLMPKYIDGYDLEVKHFVEVVAENIQSRELQFPREVRVTYHDPCQLSRFLGLTEEPRQILNAIKGIELVEPDWTNREWGTCCGGGGGFEAVFPELSEILATNRAKEMVETGAEIIVTHCPGCIMQLENGLKKIKANNVAVLDLAQVVAMAIGE